MALKEAIKLGVYDVVLVPINYTMAHDEKLMKTINEAAKKGIGLVAMKTQAGGAMRPDPKLGKPLTPASLSCSCFSMPSASRYLCIEAKFGALFHFTLMF
jgi:predicted aldo/keto reductase-like oxidoreductase